MKPFGSILEFTRERNADLMRCYHAQLGRPGQIRMDEVRRNIVEMPAARFWVSDERAAAVIALLEAGRPLPANMRPTKREMFLEIYRRFLILRRERPDDSPSDIIFDVVRQPAPKFYMLPRSAMDIIYKIKNGFYDDFFSKNKLPR